MKGKNIIIRFIKDFMIPHKGTIAICCALLILAALGDVYIPYGVERAIDGGIVQNSINGLVGQMAIIVLVAVVNFSARYVQNFKVVGLVKNISYEIKHKAIKSLYKCNLMFFSKHKAGELTSIIERDVEQVEGLASVTFMVLFSKTFSLTALLITLFLIEWRIALYVILVSPFLAFFQFRLGKRITKHVLELRKSVADINDFTQELVENMSFIQLLGFSKTIDDKYNFKQKGFILRNIRLSMLSGTISIVGQLVNLLGIILVLYFGGISIINHSMTVGFVTSLLIYVQRAYDPLVQIMQTILQIQNSSVILERIYSIIDSTDVVSEGRTDTHHEIKGSIRMSGVNFDYEGKPVLKNLNLNVKPCETLGIVGANGTGKSTIGRILVRLMDIDEGVISIDGKDIKEYSLADLRKQIMYVPSSTYIFCGTIKENILLDRIDDFDMERLKHIVELVGLKEDVENMENGYDTILYPHSVNLSSGQCQKISLARVLVKDPSVIILDEPTSALDLEIEKELTEKLEYMFKGKTIIIISHRTEILKTCDRVVMLEDGRVKDINKGVAEYADMLMAN